MFDNIKYLAFGKEIKREADRKAWEMGRHYDDEARDLIARSGVLQKPRFGSNGMSFYTPKQLEYVVDYVLDWHPLTAGELIGELELHGGLKGISRDVIFALGRVGVNHRDTTLIVRANKIVAHSLFMMKSLDEARKGYSEIGGLRVGLPRDDTEKEEIVGQGIAARHQFNGFSFVVDLQTRHEIGVRMRGIKPEIAKLITDDSK